MQRVTTGTLAAGRGRTTAAARPGILAAAWRLAVRHWAAGALAGIVIGAALLSLRWVFLVPIYEAPDEPIHFDYALTIYSAGHLLNARDGPAGAGQHPYTTILLQASHVGELAFHPGARVPSGYGTPSFYHAIDVAASRVRAAAPPHSVPWLLPVYPFGYYALAAAWIGLLSIFTHSLVALFFGTRILSVLLLMCSLVLAYGIARELGLGRARALILVACIGFFPLTSFVSSYIQPDNLGLTLVNLSLYCALRARRRPDNWPSYALLGVSLGMLLVSKYQFYFCVLLPVLAMVISRRLALRRSRISLPRLSALLLLPSLLFALIQAWVVWGASGSGAMGSAQRGQVAANYAPARQALSHGAGAFLGFLWSGLDAAFRDYYSFAGTTFNSYFGAFGWLDTRLVIGSLQLDDAIRRVIEQVTLLILALTLVALLIISYRLVRVARCSHWRRALRIACANPVLNSYFLFTVFMFFLYALTSDSFGAQGRDWFPFILPAFLVGAWFAPRAVPQRHARTIVAGAVLLGMAAYSAVGSYYAVQAVEARYYSTTGMLPVKTLAGLNKYPFTTWYSIDEVASGATMVTGTSMRQTLTVRAGQDIVVAGWAADMVHRSPAAGVFITVDDRQNFPAVYMLDRPDVARALGSSDYEHAGFDSTVPTTGLARGHHHLRIKVVARDLKSYYEPPQSVRFVIQ